MTLTGGISWILSSQGFACDALVGAQLVTVDGDVIDVDEDHEPELLWGLRGGGSNFGIVSALRMRLVPNPVVHAGALYWPMANAAKILAAYREWVGRAPPAMASAIAFLQYPFVAPVPDPVRGKPVIALRVCLLGARPSRQSASTGSSSPSHTVKGTA